jgi:predicted transcriptional regulator
MSRTSSSRLSSDDYVAALVDLGGEATSSELAEKVGRDTFTVNRMLDPEREDIDESTVSRKDVGGSYLYRYTGDNPQGDKDD